MNNILVFALMLLIVKTILFNSYKTFVILFLAWMFLDGVWKIVSGQGFFGNSILEYMILNDAQIQVPVTLIMPFFSPNPFYRCSAIGLEDIVFPALLLAYLKRFDS